MLEKEEKNFLPRKLIIISDIFSLFFRNTFTEKQIYLLCFIYSKFTTINLSSFYNHFHEVVRFLVCVFLCHKCNIFIHYSIFIIYIII